MKKLLTGIAVAAAITLLLPMTSANATLIDDAATSVAAVATGSVSITPAPNPVQPFEVDNASGAFSGLVLAGAFTANTGKAAPTAIGACAGTVTTSAPITFTSVQDLLIGGGAINGGVNLVGTGGTCSGVIGTFDGGGNVRAGTVAIAIFKLTLNIAGASGETLGTFVGAAVPSGPTCIPPVPNFGCSTIAGPVVG